MHVQYPFFLLRDQRTLRMFVNCRGSSDSICSVLRVLLPCVPFTNNLLLSSGRTVWRACYPRSCCSTVHSAACRRKEFFLALQIVGLYFHVDVPQTHSLPAVIIIFNQINPVQFASATHTVLLWLLLVVEPPARTRQFSARQKNRLLRPVGHVRIPCHLQQGEAV